MVMASAAAVLFGWSADLASLKSLQPGWVSMKISTAVCFGLAGLLLVSIGATMRSEQYHRTAWRVTVSACSLWIALLMAAVCLSYASGLDILGQTLTGEARNQPLVETVTAGIPSLGTVVGFCLVSVTGLCYVFNTPSRIARLHWSAVLLYGVSLLPLAAYGMRAMVGDSPWLQLMRYYAPGVSTAMAAPTALLFLAIALGFDVGARESRAHYEESAP